MYVLLSIVKYIARAIYALFKLLPVRKKVVLLSRRQSEESTDFRLIREYITQTYPDYTVVVLNHKMESRPRHALGIVSEMYHLATAQAAVLDSYNISVSILRHRSTLVVVQIWHALGAIKKFGHQTIGKAEGSSQQIAETMHMHRNYTYVTCGGRPTVSIFASAFDVDPKQVLPIGMPRVDYLLDPAGATQASKKFAHRHSRQTRGKKVILYAPTFRKKAKIYPAKLIGAIDFDNYILVVKQHQHDKTDIPAKKGIIIERDMDIIDILPAVDYVVTDYSATAFEAALLEKPLFFWAYDRKKYTKRRGFALDYDKEMPGIVSTSAAKVVQAIEQSNYSTARIRAFSKKYISVQDGTSTQKIVDLLKLER